MYNHRSLIYLFSLFTMLITCQQGVAQDSVDYEMGTNKKVNSISTKLEQSYRSNDEPNIAKNYEELAETFSKQLDYLKAEDYYKKSLAIYTKLKRKEDKARVRLLDKNGLVAYANEIYERAASAIKADKSTEVLLGQYHETIKKLESIDLAIKEAVEKKEEKDAINRLREVKKKLIRERSSNYSRLKSKISCEVLEDFIDAKAILSRVNSEAGISAGKRKLQNMVRYTQQKIIDKNRRRIKKLEDENLADYKSRIAEYQTRLKNLGSADLPTLPPYKHNNANSQITLVLS